MAYNPPADVVSRLLPFVGLSVRLRVVGEAANAGTQAVVVELADADCPLPFLSLNEVPHITLSTAPQSRPQGRVGLGVFWGCLSARAFSGSVNVPPSLLRVVSSLVLWVVGQSRTTC